MITLDDVFYEPFGYDCGRFLVEQQAKREAKEELERLAAKWAKAKMLRSRAFFRIKP